MKSLCIAILGLLALASLGFRTPAQDEDHVAVQQAVLDYVEGIYEVQPERIQKSVHPNLVKFGFWRAGPDQPYKGVPMTFDALFELAGKYNAEGRIPADAPKKVEVFDVMDQTASAKLTADWGIDYMQLAKEDGKWMIYHVLWQSVDEAGD